MNRLLVGDRDDDEQARDEQRDGVGQVSGGGTGQHEDEQDLLGRIGDGRHGVGGEDGERRGFAEAFVAGLSQRHRRADEQPLEEGHSHVTRLYSCAARATDYPEDFYELFTRSVAFLTLA